MSVTTSVGSAAALALALLLATASNPLVVAQHGVGATEAFGPGPLPLWL